MPRRSGDGEDPRNEAAFEAEVRRHSRVMLTDPHLKADSMPPGRRKWFEGFVVRCVEGAMLEHDFEPHSAELWMQLRNAFAGRGVVPVIGQILRLALDPDAKDERRGWSHHASSTRSTFLKDDADLREILQSALVCKDSDVWRLYPGWFGNEVSIQVRKVCSQFIPLREANDPILRALLSDEDSDVRFVAAVRLAMTTPEADDDELLNTLSDATASESWLWSHRDVYRSDRHGCHDAILHLARFGPRASASAPQVRRMIACAREDAARASGWLAREWQQWALEAEGVLAAVQESATPAAADPHFGSIRPAAAEDAQDAAAGARERGKLDDDKAM